MDPMVAYEYDTVSCMDDNQISLKGDRAIGGQLLQAIFPDAKELGVLHLDNWPRAEAGVRCSLKKTCHYRITG
jgi:hypothetical protein